VTVEDTDLELVTQPPGRPADDQVVDQAVTPLVVELRAERDWAKSEAEALRRDVLALRERVARLEGETAGVRATAIADVAAAQAEVLGKDAVITELRDQRDHERARVAKLEEWLARPWWSRLLGRRLPSLSRNPATAPRFSG
jgi:hypothetical protein